VDEYEIAEALADRLTGALEFEGGSEVAGEPPPPHEGDEAYPQALTFAAPEAIEIGAAFEVALETHVAEPDQVAGAVVQVVGATSHLVVDAQAQPHEVEAGRFVVRLSGTLQPDDKVSGEAYVLRLGLRNPSGGVGNYLEWQLSVPKALEIEQAKSLLVQTDVCHAAGGRGLGRDDQITMRLYQVGAFLASSSGPAVAEFVDCMTSAADCEAVGRCWGYDTEAPCNPDAPSACEDETTLRRCSRYFFGEGGYRVLLEECDKTHPEGGDTLCVGQEGGGADCAAGTCGEEESWRCDGDVAVGCDRGNLYRKSCTARGQVCVVGRTCDDPGMCPEWSTCSLSAQRCERSYCDGHALVRCGDYGEVKGREDCRWFGPSFTCVELPGKDDEPRPQCGAAPGEEECTPDARECRGPTARLCLGGRWSELDCGAFANGTCVTEEGEEGETDRVACSIPDWPPASEGTTGCDNEMVEICTNDPEIQNCCDLCPELPQCQPGEGEGEGEGEEPFPGGSFTITLSDVNDGCFDGAMTTAILGADATAALSSPVALPAYEELPAQTELDFAAPLHPVVVELEADGNGGMRTSGDGFELNDVDLYGSEPGCLVDFTGSLGLELQDGATLSGVMVLHATSADGDGCSMDGIDAVAAGCDVSVALSGVADQE